MTDWYSEVAQPSGGQPTATKEPPSAGGTNWYSEMAPTGANFKEKSELQPVYINDPKEADSAYNTPYLAGEGAEVGPKRLPVVDNPKYGADMGVHFKAGFADKWETMIPVAAKARFPKMPIEEAVKRYGLVDGHIVYQGDDGKLYREFPTKKHTLFGFLPAPGSLKEAGQGLAISVGGLIPKVAGAAAGIVTAPAMTTPAGAFASVRTTAGAQAGGEYLRQKIGQVMIDDPMSLGAVVGEGVQGATAQAGAGAFTGIANRFAAKDLYRMDKAAVTALEKKAERFRIPLTPAEKTNLPSLKGQQRALSNLPQSADTMDEFYRMRGERVAGAVGESLETIGKDEGADAAGMAARKAAGQIVDDMTAARAADAKPLYEAAFAAKVRVDTKPVVSYIENELKTGARGSIRSTLERAYEALKIPGTDRIDTSVQGLHNAKMEIDNMISKAATDSSIGRVAKAKLVSIQENLVKQIEAVSPDYAKARQLYADVSPGIDKVREGVIGVLSELDDDALYKAGRAMFDPARVGPTAVRNARATFTGAGKEKEFNGLLRYYLQDKFQQAGREYATAGGIATQGARFRAQVVGDPKQREILRAAMTPPQWAGFNDLMDVLEATGRAARVGSDTAWNQEAMREMRRQSGKVASNLVAPHQIPGRIREWYEQMSLGNHAEKIATTITSPDAMKQLRELRKLPPNSARAAVIVSNVLGILGEETADGVLESKETRLPESYGADVGTR